VDAQVLAIPTVAVTVYAGNASGNGIGGAPPAGEPSWVPAPGPPFAVISGLEWEEVSPGTFVVRFTSDLQLSGWDPFTQPNPWVLTANGVAVSASFNDVLPTLNVEFITGALVDPVVLTIPTGPSGFSTAAGGSVTPGTYPVPAA